eukprot:SAG31_NODE_32598_length_353_cov_1.795276_1_plen_57_part_01
MIKLVLHVPEVVLEYLARYLNLGTARYDPVDFGKPSALPKSGYPRCGSPPPAAALVH